MTSQPNILLILTDQQRADTIGALGSPFAQTPHLDALVRAGTSFTNCFVTSPVCVASRASLFNGVYPHSTNIYSNFEPWQPNWVSWLAQAGYHCVNIGKMHINPYDACGGFHQRFVVENKDRPLFLDEHERAFYDEWDKAIHAYGLIKPSRYTRVQQDPDGFARALGCFEWELPEQLHPDNFVGNTANWWLRERKAGSPFFLQVGFPGPHPPYDPPKAWLDRFGEVQAPYQPVTEQELAGQPAMHAQLRDTMKRFNIDSVAWRDQLDRADLGRLWRHYLANVSLIDAQVGQLLDTLRERGQLDNTVILFSSDHADALGEHGHIQKWTMYDSVNRVPLVCRLPGNGFPDAPRNHRCADQVQLMDLSSTILEAAGVPVPGYFEARSLMPQLSTGTWPGGSAPRSHAYAELGRDHIQSSAEHLVMRRNDQMKIVVYPGTAEGELYDLPQDPGETRNLWHEPAWRDRRDRAVTEVLQWSVLGSYRAHRRGTARPQAPMSIVKQPPLRDSEAR
ncbi:MAG: sulfatase-like hydrolase/transferase [Burkholderiaceae bacterium]